MVFLSAQSDSLFKRVHPENSFFELKKHFFDIRLKKNLFELKKVLLIQQHFFKCKQIYFFGSKTFFF